MGRTMAGKDLVSVDFKMPNYLDRFKGQYGRLVIAIASDIQTNIGLRFDAEGAYNGHPKWQDLKNKANLKTAKNGLRSRNILRRSGALKNSISPQSPNGAAGPGGYVKFQGDIKNAIVRVGTGLKYARIHDQGGVIEHPGTMNGFGKGIWISAHKIKMPRRNFTDWNYADMSNLKKTLKNTIAEILNGK